ncbi:MAG: STAS domain-containing protein [Candidatus Omnitrophica bacterium]|nr:hypothetical protein [bacterium]NUN97908.1 STAS domain-containing protein [Candidatus Omnitrophota bacterium]
MGDLSVERQRKFDSVIVSLVGTFDSTTAARVEETLEEIRSRLGERVIFNLYECEYIDEAGLGRLIDLRKSLQEQQREMELYVRPMSFVAHRTRQLPQTDPPADLAALGEERLAERRAQRLERWRSEKPIPREETEESDSRPASEEGLIPIDFGRVASLAGKDERVVREIWRTYSRLLESGQLESPDEATPEKQLTRDSRTVAHELRLEPGVVQRVIETVSSHLMEVFGEEGD